MNDDRLNGLPLPPALLEAFSDGTWTAAAGKNWTAVFPADALAGPELYGIDLFRQVNTTWLRETRSVFLGNTDGSERPGTLDPSCSLLIGEVQSDSMIALDYRDESHGPSVVFLNICSRWVKVAENFDDFWRRLVGTR